MDIDIETDTTAAMVEKTNPDDNALNTKEKLDDKITDVNKKIKCFTCSNQCHVKCLKAMKLYHKGYEMAKPFYCPLCIKVSTALTLKNINATDANDFQKIYIYDQDRPDTSGNPSDDDDDSIGSSSSSSSSDESSDSESSSESSDSETDDEDSDMDIESDPSIEKGKQTLLLNKRRRKTAKKNIRKH